MGGDHDHHHHGAATDSGLLTSRDGIRAVKVSLAALIATVVVQLWIFSVSGSVALFADLAHNLADALTALPLWLAFKLGRRPPNRRYTYGYGRAEDIAGIFIVVVIAASAVLAAWESVNRLLHPRPMDNAVWVVAAALIGFAGNEAVAVYRIKTGRRIGSAALVADGLHARSDGFTSLGVVAAGLGSIFGIAWADPVVGLVITAAIVDVLRGAIAQIFPRLMDAVPAELVGEAERLLLETEGVEDVEDVRLRYVGHRLRAEAKITVDCDRTFIEAHRIAEEAHHHLLHHLPLTEAVIHPNPCTHHGINHHRAVEHHFSDISAEGR